MTFCRSPVFFFCAIHFFSVLCLETIPSWSLQTLSFIFSPQGAQQVPPGFLPPYKPSGNSLEAIICAIMRITSFIFHPQGPLFFFAWWPGPLNSLLQIYCLVLGFFFSVRGVNLIHLLKISFPRWQKSLKANFDPVIFHLSKLNLWKLIDLTKGFTASK